MLSLRKQCFCFQGKWQIRLLATPCCTRHLALWSPPLVYTLSFILENFLRCSQAKTFLLLLESLLLLRVYFGTRVEAALLAWLCHTNGFKVYSCGQLWMLNLSRLQQLQKTIPESTCEIIQKNWPFVWGIWLISEPGSCYLDLVAASRYKRCRD